MQIVLRPGKVCFIRKLKGVVLNFIKLIPALYSLKIEKLSCLKLHFLWIKRRTIILVNYKIKGKSMQTFQFFVIAKTVLSKSKSVKI